MPRTPTEQPGPEPAQGAQSRRVNLQVRVTRQALRVLDDMATEEQRSRSDMARLALTAGVDVLVKQRRREGRPYPFDREDET